MTQSTAPVVSILLPAFDAEATLPACLRSLQRQREIRWECVLVDDGSRDATRPIAERFARGDDRIRVVTTGHAGLVEALLTGLAECRAPYVARIDADDWMHRDRLAAQYARLDAAPSIAAVGCHVRVFPRGHLAQGTRRYERWLNSIASPDDVRREAFVECPVAHPGLLLRREALERLPYRDRGWPEDYDLVLRWLRAGLAIDVLPRRLLGWRDSPQRLSRTGAAYGLDRFTACKAEHLSRGFLADTHEYTLWGYGDTGRALRRALLEHERRPSHIVEVHPGRLGQRIHGAPVVAPEALPDLPRLPIVASVAGAGPRAKIRAALAAMSFREERDFVCAA